MEVVVLMLFIVSVSAKFGKYVYVTNKSSWNTAQNYCRNHYTDLYPINTSWEESRLKNATIGKTGVQEFWIGLYNNGTQWNWSGGGHATYTSWAKGQPDNVRTQTVVSIRWNSHNRNGWHDHNVQTLLPFICFNLIVVEETMTWEQAVVYCRKTHTSFTSLASETEGLLALRKIQQHAITEPVWIGLRYLDDCWLWVNGDPLVYQAWARGANQDQKCPRYKRCGALTKDGVWENRDCQERLSFICY